MRLAHLNHHIRLLDQLVQDLSALLLLEVHRDAALVAVHREKVGTLGRQRGPGGLFARRNALCLGGQQRRRGRRPAARVVAAWARGEGRGQCVAGPSSASSLLSAASLLLRSAPRLARTLRMLHLDDICAQICQQHGAVRPGEHACEVDDAHALERRRNRRRQRRHGERRRAARDARVQTPCAGDAQRTEEKHGGWRRGAREWRSAHSAGESSIAPRARRPPARHMRRSPRRTVLPRAGRACTAARRDATTGNGTQHAAHSISLRSYTSGIYDCSSAAHAAHLLSSVIPSPLPSPLRCHPLSTAIPSPLFILLPRQCSCGPCRRSCGAPS